MKETRGVDVRVRVRLRGASLSSKPAIPYL